MKKQILSLAAAAALLAACGAKSADIAVDYGSSDLYTKEDMDAAVRLIKAKFAEFDRCELHSIRYADDSCSSEENIAWMNDLGGNAQYTECIEFLTDFHTPNDAAGAWEPDHEYKDWQWWLARTENGEWELLTFGY